MAGASIPLTPAVHQMIDIGPVPMFANATREVGYPIVRDMDTNMYERQHGNGFEIGSYAHRAILMDADDIPSIAASAPVADDAAVHQGGLRPAARGRARAVPGDRRRRDRSG